MHHPRKFWKVANDTSLVVYRETIIRGSLLYVRLGGGHTSLCETTGHQSLLPHAEVWNQWSDFRIYIYIFISLVRNISCWSCQVCQGKKYVNECRQFLPCIIAHTSMTYGRGQQNSSINHSQGHDIT